MERVVAYIDGYNLYYGLREKGWKRFYWLNLQRMIQHLLKPSQVLVCVKYFTSIVKRPDDKRRRQQVYLEALGTLTDLKIFYGHFISDTVTCHSCGHQYETHHEKMTDVNIAVELMTDAFKDSFDVAFLVSGDSDLVGLLHSIRNLFPRKRVVVAFPPRRTSSALKREADAYIYIGRNVLSKSIFPDEVIKPDGYVLRRPDSWR